MDEIRALGLCLECRNATETITSDPVTVPGRCCRQEVTCVRLNRHWPSCKAGEGVFSKEPTCDKFILGSPTKILPPFRIIALPFYQEGAGK